MDLDEHGYDEDVVDTLLHINMDCCIKTLNGASPMLCSNTTAPNA